LWLINVIQPESDGSSFEGKQIIERETWNIINC